MAGCGLDKLDHRGGTGGRHGRRPSGRVARGSAPAEGWLEHRGGAGGRTAVARRGGSRAAQPRPTAACTSGSVRYGTWVASAMIVEVRPTPSCATSRSMTRCRSALDRATTRQSRSPAAGDGVHLEHLGDRGEPCRDRVVARALADLQRDERGHRVAERGRVDVGPAAADDAARDSAGPAGPAPCRGPRRAGGWPPARRPAARRRAGRSARVELVDPRLVDPDHACRGCSGRSPCWSQPD